MLTLIQEDLTLNKDAFTKVVAELESSLSRVLVPQGRSWLRFKWEGDQKPSFEEYAKKVDEEGDEMFPSLCLPLYADYRINHIPGLFDEWFESRSIKLHIVGQSLMDQQQANLFCTQGSMQIEETLNNLKSFQKNKWRAAASLTLRFENSNKPTSHEYTDFLVADLVVSIMQG